MGNMSNQPNNCIKIGNKQFHRILIKLLTIQPLTINIFSYVFTKLDQYAFVLTQCACYMVCYKM